jgi:prepilin-type N-terminal cleavage/methylation domain-containing protein
MNCITDKQGFSLIEIAIVLVIAGLLVGMGAGMVGPLTKRVKINETKNIIDAAVETNISFGASANSLPDAATFPTIVRMSDDTWRNSLNYIFDDNLSNPSTGGICGRSSTLLTINNCFSAGCGSPNVIANVAYIILSSGGNFNNQTEANAAVSVATTINVYDTGVSVDNYSGGGDPSNVEPYDDIVSWITLNELRIKTGCTGPPIKILNNDLPSGKNGSAYSANIYADGGVPLPDGLDTDSEPDYKWCWEDDPIKGAPAGISFDCNGGLLVSATCGPLSGNWLSCTSLMLSNTPTVNDNFSLTFFVRDDNASSGTNDNIAEKTIVMTINL